MDLVDALDVSGLTCVVGAGGKKTTLYSLADRIERAVVTATVRIPIFDSHVASVAVTDDPVDAVESATEWPIGVVAAREADDRYLGYDPETVAELGRADSADAVLVKADGARMREFKAPGDREPRIPDNADTVIPIVSAHVVGSPLSEERVHRVERVAELTGLEPGDPIRPADVATVLASPAGGLKDVPGGATVIPLVNKVDDPDREAAARDIAAEILSRADVPRVVLASMTADEPVVEIIEW